MTLFAPDKPVEKSVSETTSRQFDPELSTAIQNTIAQIRSNPYDMQATQNSLQGLTVSAQNLQRSDISGSQTITTNSSQVGANVESMLAQPATQSEIFEKQMTWRDQQERDAHYVASQVIRQLEELDPAMQLNSKVEKESVRSAPNPEVPVLDPEAHKKLMGNINIELEKLGVLIDPNKAFLESTIVIKDDLKLAAANELGLGMPWKEANGLSTKEATKLAESIGTINGIQGTNAEAQGLEQANPIAHSSAVKLDTGISVANQEATKLAESVELVTGLRTATTLEQEQSLANPILNTTSVKLDSDLSISAQQASRLSETLNTVNELKVATPLESSYQQEQEIANPIANTSSRVATDVPHSSLESTKLTETLNTITALKEEPQINLTKPVEVDLENAIPNTTKETRKPAVDHAKAFSAALSRRSEVEAELALSDS